MKRFLYRSLAFITLVVISNYCYCQDQMTVCNTAYVCQNTLSQIECAGCNQVNSMISDYVVEINGLFYFDSSNLNPGEYDVQVNCNFGSPNLPVIVMPSQITVDGQSYYNDTLEYCLPSFGYELGIGNLLAGYSVNWSPSTGLSSSTIPNPVANPVITTTYTATITAPDGFTMCTSQITLIPIQSFALSLNLSDVSICAGENLVLSPAINPSFGNWLLSSSSGQTWSATNLPTNLVPDITTTYTLSVPDNSCSNLAQATVVVNPLPSGNVLNIPQLCVGDLYYLSALTSSSNMVSWVSEAGNPIGNGNNVAQIAANDEVINCQISNSFGCTLTLPVLVPVDTVCCTNDSPLPDGSSYLITSNTTWSNVNYTLTSDIIVYPGVTFQINSSTLKFANWKGIVLQDGADLRIQQSFLTNLDNCPHAWKGISAAHNSAYTSNVNQTNIGISDTEISHAYIGLSLSSTPPTFSSGVSYGEVAWAGVSCTNTRFVNNVQDLKITGYGPNFQLSQISFYMQNCVFEVQNNYPDYLIHNSNRIDIRFNSKADCVFNNCIFRNDRFDFLTSQQELVGISANLASFRVSGSVVPSGAASLSNFKGFTRGIKAIGSSNISISNTDFRCFRDLYISGNNQPIQVKNSRFLNLPQAYWNIQGNPFVSDLYNSVEFPLISFLNPSYGMYVNSCTGSIVIQDNYFNMNKSFSAYPNNLLLNSASNATEHGLVLNDCATSSGEIVRNTFTYMKRGVKCQGQNKVDALNGVKFYCNNFHGNGRDIVELASNTSPSAGLPTQQKNLRDPHNTFTPSQETFDDFNNTTNNHLYFYNSILPGNLIPSEVNNLTLMNSLAVFDCNSLAQPTSLEQNRLLFEDVINFWNNTKDGGNSSELIGVIESSNFQTVLQDMYPLIQASPYLSLDVLLRSIKNQNIPNYVLAQVLSYNSSSFINGDLKNELQYRYQPLTEFENAIIFEALNVWSSKDYLFGQLNGLEEEHQLLLSNVRLAPDSVLSAASKDSILNIYVDPSLFYSDLRYEIISLVSKGDYLDAVNLFDAYSSNFDLLPGQKSELLQIFEVAEDLPNSNMGVIDYFVNHPDLCVAAKNLISMFYADTLYNHLDFVMDEIEVRSHSEVDIPTKLTTAHLFPNPCSEPIVSIEVPLGKYRIEIFNEIGQLVIDKNCNFERSLIVLDLDNLSNGMYSVRITNVVSNNVEFQKLIIQK